MINQDPLCLLRQASNSGDTESVPNSKVSRLPACNTATEEKIFSALRYPNKQLLCCKVLGYPTEFPHRI